MPTHTKLKHHLNDIKVLFDSLRNFGICVTLAISLKFLQEPMIENSISLHQRVIVNWVVIGLVSLLTVWASVWMILSFTTKPTSVVVHRIALSIFIALGLIAMMTGVFTSLHDVPFTLPK